MVSELIRWPPYSNIFLKEKRLLSFVWSGLCITTVSISLCCKCCGKRPVRDWGHPYIKHPGKPTLLRRKCGLQGYIISFLFCLRNVDCGHMLKPPHRKSSYKHIQSVKSEKKINSDFTNASSKFMKRVDCMYIIEVRWSNGSFCLLMPQWELLKDLAEYWNEWELALLSTASVLARCLTHLCLES